MNKPTITKSSPDPFHLKGELIPFPGIPLIYMTPWMREGDVSLGAKRRNRGWQTEEGNCEHNALISGTTHTFLGLKILTFFFSTSLPPTTSRHILQNQHRTESLPFSPSTLNLSSAVIFFLVQFNYKNYTYHFNLKYSYFKFLSIFSTT